MGNCCGQSSSNHQVYICVPAGKPRIIELHSGVAQTKFKSSCPKSIKWLEIRRAGANDWLLRYPVHEVNENNEVVIQWDRDIFTKKNGWYTARLVTCDCEICGEFVIRLGKNCSSSLAGDVLHDPNCKDVGGCANADCGSHSNNGCAPCSEPKTELYVPPYSTDCVT